MHTIRAAAHESSRPTSRPRYKSNSKSKSLIYMDFDACFFCGQFVESLDFQGLAITGDKLSTKLSTEILNFPRNHWKSTT